jgi:predicted chitinase
MGDPHVSLLIAASYWYNSGLNALADQDRLDDISKKITGTPMGLGDRKNFADLALKLLSNKRQ